MTHVSAAGLALVLIATAPSGARAQSATSRPAAPAVPADDYQVQKLPALHAVVLPMKGSYGQHQTAFEKVDAFLGSHQLSRALPLFARYYNSPASVGESELVWEVGSPVPAGTVAEPPFVVKDIPAELAVVHVHRGSYAELGATWAAMTQWTIAHHHKPAGRTAQVFHSLMPPEVELRLVVLK